MYRMFNPSKVGISTSTTSSNTFISSIDPRLDKMSLTILLDLINVPSNLSSCLDSVIGIGLHQERQTILSSSLSPVQECGIQVSTQNIIELTVQA